MRARRVGPRAMHVSKMSNIRDEHVRARVGEYICISEERLGRRVGIPTAYPFTVSRTPIPLVFFLSQWTLLRCL